MCVRPFGLVYSFALPALPDHSFSPQMVGRLVLPVVGQLPMGLLNVRLARLAHDSCAYLFLRGDRPCIASETARLFSHFRGVHEPDQVS